MSNNLLEFEKVNDSQAHYDILYELLKKRSFNISHKKIPSKHDHEIFVAKHPYREWILLKCSNKYIGSFYITSDNTIGINLSDPTTEHISALLEYIRKTFKPLKAIKSVRDDVFIVNCNPHNKKLIECLEKDNLKLLQVSYLI